MSQSVSRREFLSGGFLARLRESVKPPDTPAPPAPVPGSDRPAAPMHAGVEPSTFNRRRPRQLPILRPPGAVAEPAFLKGCTRCGACISACPHDAIITAPPRMRAAAGTPMIEPRNQPCLLCEDMPCIAACEPQVLCAPAEGEALPPMGVAWIGILDCLAHQGSFCSTCVERCPVSGAIEVNAGRPRIVESQCVGCGLCQYVCPAPNPAPIIRPNMTRP